MVTHQCEREHLPVVRFGDALKRAKEQIAQVIVEDRVLVVASRDDVVVLPGLLMSRPPTHAWQR